MADQDDSQMPTYSDSDVNIPGSNLGTTAAILFGSLVTPAMLRALGGSKSMHPAVANDQRWMGALTHPDAVEEQKRLDDYMMQNINRWRSDAPSSPMIDRAHSKYGWQYSRGNRGTTDLMKEIPDLNAQYNRTENTFTHPAGDILHTAGVQNVNWVPQGFFGGPSISGAAAYYSPNRNVYISTDLLDPAHLVGMEQQGYMPKGVGMTPEKYITGVLLHEGQHGTQHNTSGLSSDAWFKEYKEPFVEGVEVPWEQRPLEKQARGVQNRFYFPRSYDYPFYDTSRYIPHSDFHTVLKYGQF